MDSSPPAETSPLALAQATLRLAQLRISALSHVVSLVSQYLDPSPRFSLAIAASSGSIGLLDRVASRLFNDQKIHEAVRDHAFARAMEAAVKNDDLVMVKQIHELHPEPVVFKTLKAAIQFGSLEMVEWIVEHRHDRLCCPPGVDNLCGRCLSDAARDIGKRDAYRVVKWLHARGYSLTPESGNFQRLLIAMSSSLELLKWFQDTGRLKHDDVETVLEHSVAGASAEYLDVIKYVVEDGVTLEEYAMRHYLIQASLQDNAEAVVEYVINSRLCDPIRDEFLYAPLTPGGKKIIQWDRSRLHLSQHHSFTSVLEGRRWFCGNFPYIGVDLLNLKNAHEDQVLEMYTWLHANSLGWWSTRALDNAAQRGHLKVVQWLHTHRSEGGTVAAMDNAAANGHLTVVQWLHSNRRVGCTTCAMDKAAANGHLAVVQWLHANRTEGCTEDAVSNAAANGHTNVVAWLFTHRPEGHATAAVIAAAASGQVETLAWLYENRPEGCTSCVLRVLLESPLQLKFSRQSESMPVLNSLRWLHDHQPETECGGACIPPQATHTSLLGHAIAASDIQLLAVLHTSHRDFDTQNQMMHAFLGRVTHLPAMQWVREHYSHDFDWRQIRDVALQCKEVTRVAWLDAFTAASALA